MQTPAVLCKIFVIRLYRINNILYCSKYLLFNPCPGSSFWWRLHAAGEYFTPGISRVLEYIATKIQRLSKCFRDKTFQWCHFRYRVTSTSTRNPRWRSPDWNVHILRLSGWWKTISNTQWENLSVHELKENKNDNIWNIPTPVKMVSRSLFLLPVYKRHFFSICVGHTFFESGAPENIGIAVGISQISCSYQKSAPR